MSVIEPLRDAMGSWGGLRQSDVDSLDQKKRAKSSMRHGRRLLCEADILAAVDWRLAEWEPAIIDTGVKLVAMIVKQHIYFDDSHPDVVEAMACFPPERRDSWSAFCALAVKFSKKSKSRELFYKAGIEVVSAYRQSQRTVLRDCDSLSKLIEEYLLADPNVKPGILFNSLFDQRWQYPEIIVDVSHAPSKLVVRARPNEEKLIDITLEAFTRRLNRIKEKLNNPSERKSSATSKENAAARTLSFGVSESTAPGQGDLQSTKPWYITEHGIEEKVKEVGFDTQNQLLIDYRPRLFIQLGITFEMVLQATIKSQKIKGSTPCEG